MKLLILAVCVCVCNAATFNSKPWQSLTSPPLLPSTAKPYVKTSYTSDADAPILRSESDINLDGFKYVYETGNGISAEATGQLKKVNDVDVLTIQGQYQYPGGPNGEQTVLTYVADENGYQPKSDLLPTSPPMPTEIVRLLEYLSQHATTAPK